MQKMYDRKINMGLFVREGLICGDFICEVIRCFIAIVNSFLVHSRNFVSVKLQRIFAFLSSQKLLGGIPSHLTD